MKFTCLRENILKALNAASKVVPVKNSLPILSHVLLKVENGRVTLMATNLETALVLAIPASIDVEGSATVSLKLLKEAVSHVSAQSLTFEADNDTLYMQTPTSKATFMCLPSSDFPSIPTGDASQGVLELNSDDLFDAISQVAFSAAPDEARPIYTGVYIFYSDGFLTFVTTDGFRLSEKKIAITTDLVDFAVIVPAKTLLEVIRILSAKAEPIRMYMNAQKNLLYLENDDVYVATGVLDGAFPEYKKIIPDETQHSAEVKLKDLLEAVRLSSVFTKEDSDALKMAFDPAGVLHIKSASEETGESASQVEAKIETSFQEGDASGMLEVAFNPRYLLDILNNLKSETILIETLTSTSPCLLKPLDSSSYLHIIMPVRLNN